MFRTSGSAGLSSKIRDIRQNPANRNPVQMIIDSAVDVSHAVTPHKVSVGSGEVYTEVHTINNGVIVFAVICLYNNICVCIARSFIHLVVRVLMI